MILTSYILDIAPKHLANANGITTRKSSQWVYGLGAHGPTVSDRPRRFHFTTNLKRVPNRLVFKGSDGLSNRGEAAVAVLLDLMDAHAFRKGTLRSGLFLGRRIRLSRAPFGAILDISSGSSGLKQERARPGVERRAQSC